MQVNVTVSINGPSGQDLAATLRGNDDAWVEVNGDGNSAGFAVNLEDLRQFVAALDRMVGDG